MKFSKLLKLVLGMAGLFTFHADGEDGGGASGPLDSQGAAAAFESFLSDDGTDAAPVEETPEAVAERLAAEEAVAADPEPAAADPAAPADGPITIEVDGKPVTLTKAELAEAVKGQMRQADYTHKTMAAAEQTRAAQVQQQAVAAERAQLAQQLNQFSIQTQGNISQLERQLTQDLWDSDPVRFLEVERSLKHGQAQIQEANQQLASIQQQQQQEQAQAAESHRTEQHAKLLAKLPDWSDPVKAKEQSSQVKDYLAGAMEMAPQEIAGISDHRLILLARKAMLYDGLMERAGKAVKRVAAAPPKVERPGVPAQQPNATDGRTAAMKQLKKSGSVRDAASLFENFI